MCSQQIKWIVSAIYSAVILFLSIAHCPIRSTTPSVTVHVCTVCLTSPPSFTSLKQCAAYFMMCSVRCQRFNAMSHLHVKSDYCSHSWLDVDRPTNQMNLCASIGFTIARTYTCSAYSMSDIPCPPWVATCESDVKNSNPHIFACSRRIVTLKVRATWFMVVTYLLLTIATKMKRLHFVNGIFHWKCLQIHGFQIYFYGLFIMSKSDFLRIYSSTQYAHCLDSAW